MAKKNDKIKIEHNGFHGWRTACVLGHPVQCEPGIYRIIVSARTGRRLDKLVCGMADCTCGERVTDALYELECDGSGLAAIRYASSDGGRTGTIRGNYPQTA